MKHILILTDTIHTGGAETFVLRLAQALMRDSIVTLYVTHPMQINYNLVKSIAPGVTIQYPSIIFFKYWQKIDSLLFKLNINYSFTRAFFVAQLKKYCTTHRVHLIHSHLFTSDMVAAKVSNALSLPLVTTMHGDYLLYSRSEHALSVSRIMDYQSRLSKVMQQLNAIVCITDDQKKQLEDLKVFYASRASVHKIYNGYTVNHSSISLERKDLKIPADAFVIGMVARGIKEKGWYELIEAFLKINIPNKHLLLVGDGPFIQEIKQAYVQANISFIGTVETPLDYIKLFDIACLPSYFESESLPTVVIEYLFCQKPVIATRKGEIPLMLAAGSEKACGLLIENGEPVKMIDGLVVAINTLYEDKALYDKFVVNTMLAASYFDMQTCVDQYKQVYQQYIPS